MDSNPYTAPLTSGAPPFLSDSDVRVSMRRLHLTHEASVKGVGTLHLIGFIFLVIGGVLQLCAAVSGSGTAGAETEWTISLSLLGMAVLQLWLGQGLRKLQRGPRVVATIFAAIGLVGFPLGTLISGYILYLLWSRKGTVVFSPEYQEIIAATPHIRYKTSMAVWIVLGLVVLAIVAGAGLLIFGSSTR